MVIDHLKILLETYYIYQSCQKSDSNRKAKVILIVVGKYEIGTKVILQKTYSNRKAKVILIVVGKHEIGTKVILQKSDSNRKAYSYNR